MLSELLLQKATSWKLCTTYGHAETRQALTAVAKALLIQDPYVPSMAVARLGWIPWLEARWGTESLQAVFKQGETF